MVSRKIVVTPSARASAAMASSDFGSGSSSGEMPAMGIWRRSYCVGQVPEGAVAGDDHPRAALGQRGAVLAVEPAQAGEVALGVGPVLGGTVGVERGERVGDRLDHGDHPGRIEPHVRVDVALEHLAVDLALGAVELRVDGQERHGGQQVERVTRAGAAAIAASTWGWKPRPR